MLGLDGETNNEPASTENKTSHNMSRRTVMKLVGAGSVGALGAVPTATSGMPAESRNVRANHNNHNPHPVWNTARSHHVTSSDGTGLYVEETGNKDGKPILFLHGIFQSRLSWDKQMFDGIRDGSEESYNGLGEDFRLVAMDLRGHGLSDKPSEVDKYQPERYADDVSAVLDALGLVNPILVGWSYGGVVIQDYIAKYGDKRIAGISLVDTILKGSASKNYAPVTHGDTFLEKIASAEKFVRSLTYNELSPRDFYYFLGFNVIAEPLAVVGTFDYTDLLPNIDVPALVTRGERDTLAPLHASKIFDGVIPVSQKSYYPNVGHMPFWENPERFNTELTEFSRAPEHYIRESCNSK